MLRNKFAKVSDPNKFFTCSGDKFQITYSSKVLPDGTIKLTPNGKINIQEYIESFKETTDIAYIMKRIACGDVSVLSRSVPLYGDFTEMPNSPSEALQMMLDAENAFNQLPLDVRNQFNNSYVEWLNTAVHEPDTFKKSFNVDGSIVAESLKEEVKTDAES